MLAKGKDYNYAVKSLNQIGIIQVQSFCLSTSGVQLQDGYHLYESVLGPVSMIDPSLIALNSLNIKLCPWPGSNLCMT